MTSRRSRLKAIANLPVRRKPAESEVKNDISCNSAVVEKVFTGVSEQIVSSSIDKVISENSNISEAVSLGSIVSQKNKEEYSQNFNFNVNWKPEESVNNNTYCNGQECEKNISQINEFRNNDTVKNINDNNDYISNFNNDYNCDLNIMQNVCDNSFKNKNYEPNLDSSVIKEKEQFESCRENIIQNSKEFESCNIDNNQFINSTISSDPDESVKCYTVLTPINIPSSNFTFATLTPCEPYDNSISKESDLNPTIESYEEVQIYTELVRSTDLQVDTPKVINSNDEFNGLEIISQQTDSLFPTSINGDNEKRSSFIKPTLKNINSSRKINTSENETLTKNSSPQMKNRERNFEFRYSMVKNSEHTNFDNLDSNGLIFKKSKTSGRKWSKCNDFAKKLSDAKREFQKKYEKRKPDRSTLKMIDLIFYNPSTNPMESKSKFEKSDAKSESGNLIEEIQQEEVDDPEAVDSGPEISISNYDESENNKKMPVPQVKIGLNGEIILDEKSLIIETTSAKKGREDLQNSVPVFEDKGYRVPYYGGKARKSREWTDFETKRFYKALNTIGPDFSLMQKYFPRRTRLELKNKFKREERLNRNLIDRALNNPSEFDMTQLENDLAVEKRAEEAVEMRLCMVRDKKTPRKKKVKVRIRSQLSREMIDSEEDSEDTLRESNALGCKSLSQTEKNKKQKEINLIFQKIVLQNSESQAN